MIRPLRDLLLLKPLTQDTGLIGGIHMPEVGSLRCKGGAVCEVLAKGKDAETPVGSRVHIPAYDKGLAGEPVEVDGVKMTLIRERDINGVLT
jgi:co-chaperonin GroES (HSP10)